MSRYGDGASLGRSDVNASGPVGEAPPRSPRDQPRRGIGARLRFLVSPRWIALIIGAISFALACYLILAPWQFGRNAERSAENAAIAAAVAAQPVDIAELMSTTAQPSPEVLWRSVTVTGTFDPGRQAYVRLRHDNSGSPASEVVVPLITADGTAVLVDRGYVSFTSVQQGEALPALPTGMVTVTGRVQADENDPRHRAPVVAPDGRMQYLAAGSEIAGSGRVFRGYLQLTAESPGVIRPIGLPQQEPGPFFSYALQWWAFGAIAVLGIGYFIYREVSDPVTGDIYLPAEGGDAPEDGDAAQGGDAPQGGDPAQGGDAAPGGDAPQGGDAAAGEPAAVPTIAEPDHALAAAPSRPATEERSERRGRRSRFDKSQLYDPQ